MPPLTGRSATITSTPSGGVGMKKHITEEEAQEFIRSVIIPDDRAWTTDFELSYEDNAALEEWLCGCVVVGWATQGSATKSRTTARAANTARSCSHGTH